MPNTTPHEPTERTRTEVRAMCSFGVPHTEMARYIGIDPKTMRKYYREELDAGATQAHVTVARYLYQNASGAALKDGASHADCVRAAMFWAKTRMGWRETSNLDVTSDGERLDMPTVIQVVPGAPHSDD